MIGNTRIKFEKTKEFVTNAIEQANISEEILQSSEIGTSIDRLDNGVFRIGVVAPFSAGKSTFINSLLGFDLLSTSILVETAAVTTVKYADEPRAEINYYDGSQITINGHEDELENFKSEIKRYTTVNREDDDFEVEKSIQDVTIYWPIELCKNGVEIVDTPGLFAQYEAHSGITTNVMASVNAVIFIIDPTTVGEVNFMSVISDYVKSAKGNSLDNSDHHIFFAVNKIDQYPESEVQKAYEELEKVLEGVVVSPKIFKVSSYLGLMMKMYENHHITLNDIRRDETIKYVDEDGFPVSGKSLNESDIPQIKSLSNIEVVNESLSSYFEEKNSFIITDVFNKLERILALQIQSLGKEAAIMKKVAEDQNGELVKKASNLEGFFKNIVARTKMLIEDRVDMRLNDATDRKSVMSKIRNLFAEKMELEVNFLMRKLKNDWSSCHRKLSTDNAENIMEDYFSKIDIQIENLKKEFSFKSFSIIQSGIESTLSSCKELVDELEHSINQKFEGALAIKQNDQSFFDFDELLVSLRIDLEKIYEGNSINEVQDFIVDTTGEILAKNTTNIRVPGAWNFIKSWVGAEDRKDQVDLHTFKKSVKEEVFASLEVIEGEIATQISNVHKKIANDIDEVLVILIKEHIITERIQSFEMWQINQLKLINEEKNLSKEKLEIFEQTTANKQQFLHSLLQETKKKFVEISEEAEEEQLVQIAE